MSDEKNIDIRLLSNDSLGGPVRSVILMRSSAKLPADARAALIASGCVPISVDNMDDVKVMPVPIVHTFDAPAIEGVAQIALETLNSSDQMRNAFGAKIVKFFLGIKKP